MGLHRRTHTPFAPRMQSWPTRESDNERRLRRAAVADQVIVSIG